MKIDKKNEQKKTGKRSRKKLKIVEKVFCLGFLCGFFADSLQFLCGFFAISLQVLQFFYVIS